VALPKALAWAAESNAEKIQHLLLINENKKYFAMVA